MMSESKIVMDVLFGSSRSIGDHWRCSNRVILYRMLEARSHGCLAESRSRRPDHGGLRNEL